MGRKGDGEGGGEREMKGEGEGGMEEQRPVTVTDEVDINYFNKGEVYSLFQLFGPQDKLAVVVLVVRGGRGIILDVFALL